MTKTTSARQSASFGRRRRRRPIVHLTCRRLAAACRRADCPEWEKRSLGASPLAAGAAVSAFVASLGVVQPPCLFLLEEIGLLPRMQQQQQQRRDAPSHAQQRSLSSLPQPSSRCSSKKLVSKESGGHEEARPGGHRWAAITVECWVLCNTRFPSRYSKRAMADAAGGGRPLGPPSLDCPWRRQRGIMSWVCLVVVFALLSQKAEGGGPSSEKKKEEQPLWVVLNPVVPRTTGNKYHFMTFQDAASFVSLFVACQTPRTSRDVLKCVNFAKGKIRALLRGALSTDWKGRQLRLVVQAPSYSMEWMMQRKYLFEAIAQPYAFFNDCMTPIALDRRLTRCRGDTTAMFDPGLVDEYYHRQAYGIEAKQGDVTLFTSFAEALIEVPDVIEIVDPTTKNVLGVPGSKMYLWNSSAGLLLLSGGTAEKSAGTDDDQVALKAADVISIGALGGTIHFKLKPDVVRAAMKMRRGNSSEFVHLIGDKAMSVTQRSERLFAPFREEPVKGKKTLHVLRVYGQGPKWENKWERVLGSGTTLHSMRCRSRGYSGCDYSIPGLNVKEAYDLYVIADDPKKLVNTVRLSQSGMATFGDQGVALRIKYLLARESSDVRSPAYRNEAGVTQTSPDAIMLWNSYKKLNAAFYKVKREVCIQGYLMMLDRRYWELETDNKEPFSWPADMDELGLKWDFTETVLLKNIRKRKKGTPFATIAAPTWSSLTVKPKAGAPRKEGRLSFRCGELRPFHIYDEAVIIERLPVDARAAHSSFYQRTA